MLKIKKEIVYITLITIGAIILRLIALQNIGGIWHDELYSWYFANEDSVFQTAIREVVEDIHTPLYFMILHLWIKVFGDSVNVMRLLSLLLSIPLIPLSYYGAKKVLKSTLCGYMSAIFLSLNTFIIYYSLEIRFYCITLPLSLLCAFSFCHWLNEDNKKSAITYIISMAILFYTFSIAPLLAFCYFIVGIIYLLISNKLKIKEFIIAHFILFILGLGAIIITLYNMYALKHALIRYPLDIFIFKPKMIYDIIENTFSFRNYQILINFTCPNCYEGLIYRLFNPKYVISIFAPCALAIAELFRGIISKDKKFHLFFYPSLLFIVFSFFLFYEKIVSLQPRYMALITPILIVSFFYCLDIIKNKKRAITLFLFFMILNFSYIFCFDGGTIFDLNRQTFTNFSQFFEDKIKYKNNDLILAPTMNGKISYFIKESSYIPFNAVGAFILKDKNSLKFYFGDDYKNIKRENVRDYLNSYTIKDIPLKAYDKNLYNSYIKDLKQGQKVILVLLGCDSIFFQKRARESSKSYPLSSYIIPKASRDSYLVLNKYLKLKSIHKFKRKYEIYVFEK